MMDGCQCDPLRKCLEAFFCALITQKQSLHLQTISEKAELDPLKVKVKQLVKKYLEKCVNSYKGLLFRPRTTVENIIVTITYENIKRAREIWIGMLKQNSATDLDYRLPNIFSEYDSSLSVKMMALDKMNNVRMNLESQVVYKSILGWILENYPRSSQPDDSCHPKRIKLDVGMTELADDVQNMPLVQYRKFLIALYTMRAMAKSGYSVDVEKFHRLPCQDDFLGQLFLVFTDTDFNSDNDKLSTSTVFRFNIGNVILKNSSTNEVRKNSTAEYLLNLRSEQVNTASHLRNNFEHDSLILSASLSNLAIATINYDLLFKEPKSDIIFQYNDQQSSNSFQDKGGFLIMYNYSRVVSILKKFEQNVTTGLYPTAQSLHEIEFSNYSESEKNLLSLLLQWPRTVENTVDLSRKEIKADLLLKLMFEITQRFVNFYTTEHVIMKDSTPHNVHEMMKRIYLLRAIRNIYEEFLELLVIDYDKTNDNDVEASFCRPKVIFAAEKKQAC